jgi:hypothetical protein
LKVGSVQPCIGNTADDTMRRDDRAADERQRGEHPERQELRGEDLPSSDGPRQQQLVRPFRVLGRDDVAAEDRDEQREEQEAGDVREGADEARHVRLFRIDVVVEIELQAADLRAHGALPRRIHPAAAEHVLRPRHALLQIGAPVAPRGVVQHAVLRIRDEQQDRGEDAEHDGEPPCGAAA